MCAVDQTIQNSSARQVRLVFSLERNVPSAQVLIPAELSVNTRQKMDGLAMMQKLPDSSVTVAFLDPQYRGILDKLAYGNEGVSRNRARCSLEQMSQDTIHRFITEIDRLLIPNGHLFLWMDKFRICTGFSPWIAQTHLETVDLITWNKKRMGMGYRTRRTCEYLVILQRAPKRAKGVWKSHRIPDVWDEKADKLAGVHPKPVGLQAELIEAVSNPGDLVLDPAAGSFSVLKACQSKKRTFIGCDLNG